MAHENSKIEVRDLRDQEWVWTSKAFLFDENVDEKMYKTYCGIAAYANNQTQQAYPTINTLSRKLHMGRTTIMRAMQKLEKYGFISVDRKLGEHNVYTLISEYSVENKRKEKKPVPSIYADKSTPADIARDFFQGINDLKTGEKTPMAEEVANMLRAFTTKYPQAPKDLLWKEVQAFERYWTELNKTGKQQRWEKQETFQIDRRLVTWFANKKEFSNTKSFTPSKKRIV